MLKMFVITAETKKYKSIIKKKKKKHDKRLPIPKSMVLVDSIISHHELNLGNVPNKFDDIKKEIKTSNHK